MKQSLDRKIRLQKKIATLARQLNGYESAARRAVAVALEDMGRRDGLKVVSASQYDELITGRTWLQEQLDTARSLMAQQDAEISRLRAAVPCSNGEDRQNFGALAEAAHEQ